MRVKEIASDRNPVFRLLSKLTTGREIRRHKRALLSGPKQVVEVLCQFPDRCEGVISPDLESVSALLGETGIPVYLLSPALFQRIDLHGTGRPLVLLRVDPLPEWSDSSWPPGCSLFIPFQDPANVGAVIRSAAAFGVARVILLQEAAHPFLPRAIRAAGSDLLRVPLLEGPSITKLKIAGAPVVTLATSGRDLRDYAWPAAFALIPGIEGPGLPEHLAQANPIAIPMAPGVESLNAAVATGIALYAWRFGTRAPAAGIGPRRLLA